MGKWKNNVCIHTQRIAKKENFVVFQMKIELIKYINRKKLD